MPQRVVIVGAGHGGGTAAAMLRQHGFDGEVVLVGDEPVGPYHRPPLSKSLLKGELLQPLQPADFYTDQSIDVRTCTKVVAIDRDARAVRFDDGESLEYDALVLATGARARALPLPGAELDGVHELRTLAHAEALSTLLSGTTSVAIVGGGWIGLEVAASAREAGAAVTVLEREERLLTRVASAELADALTQRHLSAGVEIRTGVTVTGLRAGADGHVAAVTLADSSEVAADLVLIAIGAVPDDELARSAGLRCEDGIVVDAATRTDDPRIFAIGDVASQSLGLLNAGSVRLESIPSAIEQARQAVAAILEDEPPVVEVPWFWSDQFDQKIQIAGLLQDVDRTVVRDRQPDRLSVVHLHGDRLVAIEAVNATRDFVAARNVIRGGAPVDVEILADSTVPIHEAVVAIADDPVAMADDAAADAPDTHLPGPGGTPGEPRVVLIQADGRVDAVGIEEGMTLMEAAVRHNVPGIIAECGGTAACGTCHVVVEGSWRDRLADPGFDETDLLEFLENSQDGSRLGCQIPMTDDLDGIVVRVPPPH